MDWILDRTGMVSPLTDYVYSDPLPGLVEQVRLSHYLGGSRIMGVNCIHLAFKQDTINWQVWVEDSATPVPRKVAIEYKTEPGAPEYVALLSDWQFPDAIPEAIFRFTPPEGASRMQLSPPLKEVD